MTTLNVTTPPSPTLTGLTATAAVKGVVLLWDALQDQNLFAAEIWISDTNDRTAATLLATITTNFFFHAGLASSVTKYYWIRAKDIYGRTDGAWEPAGSTAGVTATTL